MKKIPGFMNKILVVCLCLMALTCPDAQAQSDDAATDALQFVLRNGDVVPDGSVLVIETMEEDPFGGALMPSGLYVRNNAEEDVVASIEVSISSIDGGVLQCCFPQNCQSYVATGTYETPSGTVAANTQRKNLQTEWVMPSATYEGEATARLRIKIYRQIADVSQSVSGTFQPASDASQLVFVGYGPTVNICFSSPALTAIHSATYADTSADTTSDAKSSPSASPSLTGIYSLSGRRLSAPQKGINIFRYSDGTTRKVVK